VIYIRIIPQYYYTRVCVSWHYKCLLSMSNMRKSYCSICLHVQH